MVIKYACHETGVKRFLRFHNFVVSSGYLEKKYNGSNLTAGVQSATLLMPYVQPKNMGTAKSASSL